MVRLKCDFENGIDVGAVGSKGGLSLEWKENSLVSLRSFSSFHIDVEIHDNERGDVCLFLGLCWGILMRLLTLLRKKGGCLRSERQMNPFRTTLEDCNLRDLGFVGQWFTWERGKFSNTNIRERLDRRVVTLSWINIFPSYQIEHLSHFFSDHCPILLDTMKKSWNDQCSFDNGFRFEAKWCLDSSFEEMVRSSWNDVSGSVPLKLERLRSLFQR
ncbi:hypothetical protein CXB51_032030 [Gossypium anomalum]|uniref:Endonuclease/exonuclease/phosphatase domain-containing protein n=1 Tax=Gossypium anomalum TaxID=47600 RepID=A0A8J5Y2F6_9ROSI|nr:hypothetical protein CXB51_032030 [Gossypium anomalum]